MNSTVEFVPVNHDCDHPELDDEVIAELWNSDGCVRWNCADCGARWRGDAELHGGWRIEWVRTRGSSRSWKKQERRRLEVLQAVDGRDVHDAE